MRNGRPVLLVENDRVDAWAVKRSFGDLRITNKLVHLRNGEEALQHLKSPNAQKPCLVLLDLNMPRMDGIEFLKAIRADQELRRMPVVVLSTSQEESDRLDSFKLSVSGYVAKPADYVKFVEAVRAIHLYWTLSETPPDPVHHSLEDSPADGWSSSAPAIA